MRWRIQQALSVAGRSTNEDICGAAGAFAWVLDGAGLGNAPRFAGHATDAEWLVRAADRWLHSRAHDLPDLDVALTGLAEHLSAAFGVPDPDEPSGGPSACLVMAHLRRVSGGVATVDLAWIADTVALAPQATEVVLLTDDRVAPFEARTLSYLRGTPAVRAMSHPERVALARAQIRANRAYVNQPDGYAVVSATRPWLHLVQRRTLMLDAAHPLVMMTDGVSRLMDMFDRYDPVGLHAACAAGRCEALLAELRALEAADPHAERFVRSKNHDDATVLVVAPEM